MRGLASTFKSIKGILRRPLGRDSLNETSPLNVPSSAETVGDPTVVDKPIGILSRPWRRIINKKEPETVFVLAKRNYKVYAYLGLTKKSTNRYMVVLDTGAGSSFIRRNALPSEAWKLIRPLHSTVRIRDANNRSLNIQGTVNLTCTVGGRSEIVTFYVVERLATEVILGCDYCDKHVESIRPRRRLVEMEDGSTVPIVRRPDKRKHNTVPLPEEQEYVPLKGRISNKIAVSKEIKLPPETQSWIEVTCEKHGIIQVEPLEKLFTNQLCMVGNGIAQVKPGIPFKVLIANMGRESITLLKGQKIAAAEAHPTTIIESDVMLAEMLGCTREDAGAKKKSTYRKRQAKANDTELINRHLADLRESHMEKDEEPITAEDIPLDDVPTEYHDRVRRMLQRHEHMWLGKLGNINVIEHGVDLKPG